MNKGSRRMNLAVKAAAILVLGMTLAASPAAASKNNYQPSNTVNSELGHVAGGAVSAAAVTYLVDRYWPAQRENRGWIGFGLSALGGVVGEGIQYLEVDYFSWLDAGSHVLGSIIGAYVTDRFILAPVVETGPGDKVSRIGVIARFDF